LRNPIAFDYKVGDELKRNRYWGGRRLGLGFHRRSALCGIMRNIMNAPMILLTVVWLMIAHEYLLSIV
jgi:hypothetical protein